MMEKPSVMNVKMTKEFAEQIFVRDGEGNKLSVEWGEPDKEGFYVPICSVDYEDNIVASLRTAVEYAKALCYKHSNGDDVCHCEFYDAALGIGERKYTLKEIKDIFLPNRDLDSLRSDGDTLNLLDKNSSTV